MHEVYKEQESGRYIKMVNINGKLGKRQRGMLHGLFDAYETKAKSRRMKDIQGKGKDEMEI